MLDETLVVIAADHGEAFGERGFEGHARNVYQEVTEVPFVISFPFRLEPGLVIDSRTQNVDIWPTLLDLLGLPPLEPSDGKSLVPLIRAAARGEAAAAGRRERVRPARSDLGAAANRPRRWWRSPPTASAIVLAKRGEQQREELFDPSRDPIETVDVQRSRIRR